MIGLFLTLSSVVFAILGVEFAPKAPYFSKRHVVCVLMQGMCIGIYIGIRLQGVLAGAPK